MLLFTTIIMKIFCFFIPLFLVSLANCQMSRDTLFGYSKCVPETIIQFEDKSWMAIERSRTINQTSRSPARIAQWIHWKDNKTPLLFMNPSRLPRLTDFFPDITNGYVTSGYRKESTLVLTTQSDQPIPNSMKTRHFVFEYEIGESASGFFSLVNRTETFDYFPFLKTMEEENKWIFYRILASTFISGPKLSDQRVLVRAWFASKNPYDPKVIVEARLFPNHTVDAITRFPPEPNSPDIDHIDSITYLSRRDVEEQQEQFLISSQGFWARIMMEREATFINFPSKIKGSMRNEVMLTNSFFGCPESPCFTGEVDAITDTDAGITLFKNQYYWSLSSFGPRSQLSKPRLISDNWNSFVGFLDAAVNIVVGKERRLLFFRGRKVHYCHVSGNCYRTFYISYAFPGMTSVDAAFVDDRTNQLFLIKGNTVTSYSSIIEGYPARQAFGAKTVFEEWDNMPENVQDAYWTDGKVLFFSQGFVVQANATSGPIFGPFNLFSCNVNFSRESGWEMLSIRSREDIEGLRRNNRPVLMQRTSEETDSKEAIIEASTTSSSTPTTVFIWIFLFICIFLMVALTLRVAQKLKNRKQQEDRTTFVLDDLRFQ